MQEYSRLIAISFLLNTLVYINEIGCCFILGKKFVFWKGKRVLKLNMFDTFSSQVILYYWLTVMDFWQQMSYLKFHCRKV